MDLEKLEKYRQQFSIFKSSGCTFEECLAKCGLSCTKGEERENFKFAFDHLSNWSEVEKKFSKAEPEASSSQKDDEDDDTYNIVLD